MKRVATALFMHKASSLLCDEPELCVTSQSPCGRGRKRTLLRTALLADSRFVGPDWGISLRGPSLGRRQPKADWLV
jgi:hypothetical protein